MKYVVTAPPGGLGHFLSRILANEYDFSVELNGSYHSLKIIYSSQTTQIETFDKVIHDTSNPVVCLHNFDNRDLTETFNDRTVINIVVDSYYEIFLNNYFRKAIHSNLQTVGRFLKESQIRFPTSKNFLREEFFFMYQSMIKKEIAWLPQHMIGHEIPFSSFYKSELFMQEMHKIAKFTNLKEIWTHFINAQQPIINRVNLYQSICDQVVHDQQPEIPRYFDNVDFGIMCGMIVTQHGIDMLNLENNNWV
jgi:hypothetical protein